MTTKKGHDQSHRALGQGRQAGAGEEGEVRPGPPPPGRPVRGAEVSPRPEQDRQQFQKRERHVDLADPRVPHDEGRSQKDRRREPRRRPAEEPAGEREDDQHGTDAGEERRQPRRPPRRRRRAARRTARCSRSGAAVCGCRSRRSGAAPGSARGRAAVRASPARLRRSEARPGSRGRGCRCRAAGRPARSRRAPGKGVGDRARADPDTATGRGHRDEPAFRTAVAGDRVSRSLREPAEGRTDWFTGAANRATRVPVPQEA